MRRRARFLRKARELALRDLGGLVFEMHRFGQSSSDALLAKLATLRQIDSELRGLDRALGEGQGVTVLREAGIAACPRCAAIHGRDDRFCPGCGLAFDSQAERPIATSPVSIPGPQGATSGPQAAATPAPAISPAQAAGTPTPPPPPIKPTASPVAARPPEQREQEPGSADGQGRADERAPGETSDREQPTQILRPPAGGG